MPSMHPLAQTVATGAETSVRDPLQAHGKTARDIGAPLGYQNNARIAKADVEVDEHPPPQASHSDYTSRMVIRSRQMEAFRASRDEELDRNLTVYARQRFPETFQSVSDERLLAYVRQVRETAGEFGVDRRDNVATFVDFSVMYGPDFYASPWASDIMFCDALHGPDKIAILRSRVEETGIVL